MKIGTQMMNKQIVKNIKTLEKIWKVQVKVSEQTVYWVESRKIKAYYALLEYK